MTKWKAPGRRLAMAATAVVVAGTMASGGGLGSAVAAAQQVVPNPTGLAPPVCPAAGVDDKCEAWTATWRNNARPPVQGVGLPGSGGSGAHGGDNPIGGIAVSPDGDRIFQFGTSAVSRPCGTSQGFGVCQDVVTVARDADGRELWATVHTGRLHDNNVAREVEVSPDGRVVYTLLTEDIEPMVTRDAFIGLVAYDAATGDELWKMSYTPHPFAVSWAQTMVVSPDGDEIYVAAHVYGRGGRGYPGNDHVDSITGQDGGDFLTVAVDAHDGAVLWDATYDEPTGTQRTFDLEIASDIAVSPDGGRVYVTGKSISNITGDLADDATSNVHASEHLYDYATVAYNTVPPNEPGDPELGAELWADRFDGAGLRDVPSGGLAVSPDGARVFVTGVSAVGHTGDSGQYMHYLWQTIAYEADTGQRVWRQEHGTDGEGYLNEAKALTVSPDGTRLYVAGTVDGRYPVLEPRNEVRDKPGKLNVVAYDVATGEELLDARHVPPDADSAVGLVTWAHGVRISPDGETVYIAGGSGSPRPRSGWSPTSIITVAFDASTGTRRWVARSNPGALMSGSQGLFFSAAPDNPNSYFALSDDGQRLYASGLLIGSSGLGVNLQEMLLLAYDTQPPGSGTQAADSLVGESAAALPASPVG